MTDIPDDVIERAARAIADRWSGATHSDQPFDTLSAPTQNVMRWCARAALSAVGYGEMAAEIERLRALTTWRTVDENTPRDGRKLCMWAPGFGLGALTLYWMDGNWREPKDGCGLKVEPTHWLPVIPPDGGWA